jgi:hypothetical protein
VFDEVAEVLSNPIVVNIPPAERFVYSCGRNLIAAGDNFVESVQKVIGR